MNPLYKTLGIVVVLAGMILALGATVFLHGKKTLKAMPVAATPSQQKAAAMPPPKPANLMIQCGPNGAAKIDLMTGAISFVGDATPSVAAKRFWASVEEAFPGYRQQIIEDYLKQQRSGMGVMPSSPPGAPSPVPLPPSKRSKTIK